MTARKKYQLWLITAVELSSKWLSLPVSVCQTVDLIPYISRLVYRFRCVSKRDFEPETKFTCGVLRFKHLWLVEKKARVSKSENFDSKTFCLSNSISVKLKYGRKSAIPRVANVPFYLFFSLFYHFLLCEKGSKIALKSRFGQKWRSNSFMISQKILKK